MSKYLVQAGWSHAPHLTADARRDLLESIPAHERDARMNGTPTLGEGKIYDIDEEIYTVDNLAEANIPPHWRRGYALDVGWQRTATIWGALDPDSDVLTLYSEHYGAELLPALHAEAIKARGEWIPGVIDPASRGRSQIDGEQLVMIYRRAGLDLEYANNKVEAGIYEVRQRLMSGRLKVCKGLTNWFAEVRLYRRDEGKVVKKKDHLQDATRYLVMSGISRMTPAPAPESPIFGSFGGSSWMA
jgi:Terminase RNaseH-like domain